MQNFYQQALPLPIKDLEQMFMFILKLNYFEFDKKYYLQIHITEMGSVFHQTLPIYLCTTVKATYYTQHQMTKHP